MKNSNSPLLFTFFLVIAILLSCTPEVQKEEDFNTPPPSSSPSSPTSILDLIIANNSNLGFAAQEKGRKDTLMMIAKTLKANNFDDALKMGNKYLDSYGMDREVSFLLSSASQATDNSITWKGGTPGRERDWTEPKNWDANRVPDEDSQVIIKFWNSGHQAQPILKDEVQIASLDIYSNAELVVTPDGKLIIDGEYTYSEGISIYGGKLSNKGEVVIKNIDKEFILKSQPVATEKANEYVSELFNYKFVVIP